MILNQRWNQERLGNNSSVYTTKLEQCIYIYILWTRKNTYREVYPHDVVSSNRAGNNAGEMVDLCDCYQWITTRIPGRFSNHCGVVVKSKPGKIEAGPCKICTASLLHDYHHLLCRFLCCIFTYVWNIFVWDDEWSCFSTMHFTQTTSKL